MLSIRYFAPAAPLRQWISSYYLFCTDAPAVSDLLRAELPQVRFFVQGHGSFGFGDGVSAAVPATVLTGPTSVAVRFDATGPLTIFGAGLLPAGWAALVGAGAAEFANSMIDLGDIAGTAARSALNRMGDAPCPRGIVAAADAFFLLLSSRAKPPPLWFTRATDDWLAGHTDPDVNVLVAQTGMSARQVERLALRIYGATPKLLARKYRTLQAAVRLGLAPEAGWEAAARGVFYDQSHFIREFKMFVGMTPSRFVDKDEPWNARLKIAKQQDTVTIPKLNLVS
jgi:AraC-like DNA-binding protein